jgi:hypothetical protein
MSPSARFFVSESVGSFQGFGQSSGVMMEGGATCLEGDVAWFGLQG